jgi:hypothetical protein
LTIAISRGIIFDSAISPLWKGAAVSSYSDSEPTVDARTAISVDTEPTSVVVDIVNPVGLWTAEGIGGFFPGSRLREIRNAQDVLTHTEEKVYDVFWGNKDPSPDRERIVRKGYDIAAKETRVTKRNIVNIVQRLISKGFLELVAPPAVYGQRRPATYRVLSYAAVRENQKRRGREWVIHVGSGIGYACSIEVATSDVDPAKAASDAAMSAGGPTALARSGNSPRVVRPLEQRRSSGGDAHSAWETRGQTHTADG